MKIERMALDAGDGTVVTLARRRGGPWVIISLVIPPRFAGTLDLTGLDRSGAARRTYCFLADPDGVDLPLPDGWQAKTFQTAEEALAFIRKQATSQALSRLPFLY